MRRMGVIPERTHTGPLVNPKKAAKMIGRRFRLMMGECWAAGLCKDGKLWVDMESAVEAGAVGTFNMASGLYVLNWDPSDDLRLGYTTMNQRTLDHLIRRKVLVEITEEGQ